MSDAVTSDDPLDVQHAAAIDDAELGVPFPRFEPQCAGAPSHPIATQLAVAVGHVELAVGDGAVVVCVKGDEAGQAAYLAVDLGQLGQRAREAP